MITKEELRILSQEELKVYFNEYIRRYRIKNRDRINAINRDYRKKNKPALKPSKAHEPLETQKPESLNIF